MATTIAGNEVDPKERDWLNAVELARALGVARQTLYKWIAAGKIPEPRRDPVTKWPKWNPADIEVVRAVLAERR
jgi:predicted site-specific integrase-resolvase